MRKILLVALMFATPTANSAIAQEIDPKAPELTEGLMRMVCEDVDSQGRSLGRVMIIDQIFTHLLARAFACSICLSHLPLLSGYNEPRTLSYQISLFGPISADVRHQHAHSTMGTTGAGPTETGQSAFAAMAEIVALLRTDDATDWATVDIPALQRHLVDMDLLTTQSVSVTTPTSTGAVFEVSGSGIVIDALHRMVSAHAPFLDAETDWTTEVAEVPDGVVKTVTGDASMIQGLGFHGLMTIGAHHQDHHLMIATGRSPHL